MTDQEPKSPEGEVKVAAVLPDETLVQEAFKIYLTNPLATVADDAYGMLILQLMQRHPEWPALANGFFNAPDPIDPVVRLEDEPQLLTMLVDWPKDCNRLDAVIMQSMAGMLVSELCEFAETQPELRVVAGSVRVICQLPDHRLMLRFIVVERNNDKPETKGQ